MITPDQLEIGLLIWWTYDKDWGGSWDTPGKIVSIDPVAKKFQVFTYDDSRTTTVNITDPNKERDTSMGYMRVVTKREVERYLQDRTRKFEDRVIKAQRELEDAEDALEDWKNKAAVLKANI